MIFELKFCLSFPISRCADILFILQRLINNVNTMGGNVNKRQSGGLTVKRNCGYYVLGFSYVDIVNNRQ